MYTSPKIINCQYFVRFTFSPIFSFTIYMFTSFSWTIWKRIETVTFHIWTLHIVPPKKKELAQYANNIFHGKGGLPTELIQ